VLNLPPPITKLAAMLRSIPNILTVGRIILSIVFLVMLLFSPRVTGPDRAVFFDIAFVVFVVAGLTDVLDGPIARRLNVTSKFGRMVDPLADKALVCGAFVCFAIIGEPKLFNLTGSSLAAVHWFVAVVLIAREAYVTVLRHIAEARGVNFAATFSGKIKMFIQSFAIGTVLIKAAHVPAAAWASWFTAAVFAAMLAVTVVSGLLATRRGPWQQLAGRQS